MLSHLAEENPEHPLLKIVASFLPGFGDLRVAVDSGSVVTFQSLERLSAASKTIGLVVAFRKIIPRERVIIKLIIHRRAILRAQRVRELVLRSCIEVEVFWRLQALCDPASRAALQQAGVDLAHICHPQI